MPSKKPSLVSPRRFSLLFPSAMVLGVLAAGVHGLVQEQDSEPRVEVATGAEEVPAAPKVQAFHMLAAAFREADAALVVPVEVEARRDLGQRGAALAAAQGAEEVLGAVAEEQVRPRQLRPPRPVLHRRQRRRRRRRPQQQVVERGDVPEGARSAVAGGAVAVW